MNREHYKTKKIDRSTWKAGVWDVEPDFYEWTTQVGYSAWMGRLDSGAWFGIIEAPCPTEGVELKAFCSTLRDKRFHQLDHQPGMIGRTDREEIGAYTISLESWECPGSSKRTWFRGPYKTLVEVRAICENVAQDIYETYKDGTYIHYFDKGK